MRELKLELSYTGAHEVLPADWAAYYTSELDLLLAHSFPGRMGEFSKYGSIVLRDNKIPTAGYQDKVP